MVTELARKEMSAGFPAGDDMDQTGYLGFGYRVAVVPGFGLISFFERESGED